MDVSNSRKRRSWTIQEKRCIVRNIQRRITLDGKSIRKACKDVNIDHKQFLSWRQQCGRDVKLYNPRARSLCAGPKSILDKIAEDLLKYIFELREQGMAVSITTVMLKACHLSRVFKDKTRTAQYASARRFVQKHGYVHRLGTNESQRSPSETANDAKDFMQYIRPVVVQNNRHHDYILNMDQTPIPFTFNAKRTLEMVGARTIHVRKSTNDTKRATCALTVTASGKLLTPFLIFKGKPNGRIVQKEFPSYPKENLYACQENAWMDESATLVWVEKILKPYVLKAPDGVVPILFLDSYRCHMMKSVVNAIQDCGVEVQHIPGGCTGLCQPVDVGINKPYKSRIKQLWESWMIQEGLIDGTTSPPTRELISKWAAIATKELPVQIVRNAWLHGEYTWFPASCAENDEIASHENENPYDENDDDDETKSEIEKSDDDETESKIKQSDNDDETKSQIEKSDDDETESEIKKSNDDDETESEIKKSDDDDETESEIEKLDDDDGRDDGGNDGYDDSDESFHRLLDSI